MSKDQPLDAAAFARARVQPEVLRSLEAARRRAGAAPHAWRVLDWGCGRGDSVLLLREQGYAAFGVDVAAAPLGAGRLAAARLGLDGGRLLHEMEPGGKLPFADASFDFAFSEQVLEHVADLDALARELARVLRPGARAFHVLPARWTPVEEHLGMPFVHWLPKGRLQRLAIAACAACGLGPRHWLAERPWRERWRRWAQYSELHTFHRSPGALRRHFERHGFAVRFVASGHPRLRALPGIGRALRFAPLRRLVDAVLARFYVVELEVERPRALAGAGRPAPAAAAARRADPHRQGVRVSGAQPAATQGEARRRRSGMLERCGFARTREALRTCLE